ncbi:hypothetical protein ABT346_14300 [Micromonospora peucetia]|uniref:hypothetical protein n=1 Tax=Micromonospora peucetia TaxID=47871 RepID=UPI003328BE81
MERSVRRHRQPQPNGAGQRGVLWLANGVLVGVGGVFLTTASALVTAIAAAAAVTITVAVVAMTGR